jgi:hypothetical protein
MATTIVAAIKIARALPALAACLFYLGSEGSGCIGSRIIVMEQKISHSSKGAL